MELALTQEECFNKDTILTIQLPKSSEQINLFRLIPSRDEIHKYNIENDIRNMIRTHDHARSKVAQTTILNGRL